MNTQDKKRIIFMGTPSFATTIFNALYQKFEVVALFTQPDKKGNKNKITKPHILEFCLQNSIVIPIYQMDKLNTKYNIDLIKSLKPDFIIVAAFGHILKKEILNIAPCINLHASILPLYRGSSPIQYSILNGDKYTGVTAMLMQEGLDCGDILATTFIKINNYTNKELFDKLASISTKLIINVIKNFNNILPIKQSNIFSSYAYKIKKEDGRVEFNNAIKITRQYRAYKNWPSIYLKSNIKLTNIRLKESNSTNEYGKILDITDRYVLVGCLKGSVEIISVQVPTKKEISAVSYVNTKKFKIGDIFF